ncbi:MAG: dephospho-CoA kinase [Gaiellales bacterium]|nr:dephospho-CoA kinase [Gaiellales bacterium]
MSPPLVVGLTGGIGSGKSEALAAFKRHGAATLSSDEVVRELYQCQDVRRAVREHFGPGAITADGSVDRAHIAERVFSDAEQRRWLEALLLPLIAVRFAEWRDAEVAAGAPLLVHEAPTLFEAGTEGRYDTIVTITAPQELRQARRPGSEARMAHQLPESEKVARSHHVYRNSGSLDELDRWVADLVARLT